MGVGCLCFLWLRYGLQKYVNCRSPNMFLYRWRNSFCFCGRFRAESNTGGSLGINFIFLGMLPTRKLESWREFSPHRPLQHLHFPVDLTNRQCVGMHSTKWKPVAHLRHGERFCGWLTRDSKLAESSWRKWGLGQVVQQPSAVSWIWESAILIVQDNKESLKASHGPSLPLDETTCTEIHWILYSHN